MNDFVRFQSLLLVVLRLSLSSGVFGREVSNGLGTMLMRRV